MRTLKVAVPLFFFVFTTLALGADEMTWTGTLGDKPANAKEGVVAVLHVKTGEKEQTVNLWATGDTATTLKEWAGKSAKVTITGTKVDDQNVKVDKVVQAKE
jgi:hypothetical protein